MMDDATIAKMHAVYQQGLDAFKDRDFTFSRENVIYISFALDNEFLGGAYIPADSIEEAIVIAHLTHIVPGETEAKTVGPIPASEIDTDYTLRLITDKDEIERAYIGEKK